MKKQEEEVKVVIAGAEDPVAEESPKKKMKRKSERKSRAGKGEDGKEVKVKGPRKQVSTLAMFRFADGFETFLIILGTVAALATGSARTLQMLVMGSLLNTLNYNLSDSSIDNMVVNFVYIAAGTFVCATIQVICFTIASERITIRLREKYLQSVLSQDITFFDLGNSGELASSVAENSLVYREAVGEKFANVVQSLSMFLSGFVLGFVKLWDLTLVILATVPLLIICGALGSKIMGNKTVRQLQAYAESGAIAEETISQIRTVAGLGIERKRLAAYDVGLEKAERAGVQQARAQGLALGGMMLVMFCSYGIGFYYGSVVIEHDQVKAIGDYPLSGSPTAKFFSYCAVGNAIPKQCSNQNVSGQFFESEEDVCNCPYCGCGCWAPDMVSGASGWSCANGGTVIMTFFAVLIGAMSVGQAAPGITAFSNGRAAAAAIYEIIERKPAISDHAGNLTSKKRNSMSRDIKGELALENIYYTYASRPDMPLFTGLNLSIPAGKTVALVGESGSGKSTVISLIERFYDPTQGRITIDGVDIRELDPKWYRSLFGYVGQEPMLFATTIRRNIEFGVSLTGDEVNNENVVSMEQIEAAAKASNAHDFISTFPNKYETVVGGGGSQLSGGQKQRIAIARALVRDPKILLLDEATSALDNESERIVQAAIDEMIARQSRTTIVVAHRLSTVKNADKIVVLGRGKLLEEGNHSELMELNGTYAALVNIANKGASKHAEKEGIERDPESEGSGASSEEVTVQIPADESTSEATTRKQSMQKGPNGSKLEMAGSVVIQVPGKEDDDSSDKKSKKKLKKKKERSVPVSRAFQFARPEKLWFIPGVFFAALNGATFPLFAIIFSNMTNVYFQVSTSVLEDQARLWCGLFACLGVMTGTCNAGQNWVFGLISARMTTRVRAATFKAVIRNEIGFFDMPENSVGTLTSTLASDASLVKSAIADSVAITIMNTVTVCAGIVVAFVASWQTSLVVLAIFPLLALSSALQMKIMHGLALTDQSALADASQVLTESVLGIRTVTALGLKDRVVALYSSFLSGPMKLAIKKGYTAGLANGFGQALPLLANALAFWYGGRLVTAGTITFQELLQSFFGIMMMSMALGRTSALNADIAKGKPAIRSIFGFIDRVSKIDPLTEAAWLSPQAHHSPKSLHSHPH